MASSNLVAVETLLKLLVIGAQFPDWNSSFVPPGLTDPKYVPPYNGEGVLPLSIFLLVVTVIVVSLRLFARGYLRTSTWGWDDWFIIPATVCAVVEVPRY
jgi:hypothetical protein